MPAHPAPRIVRNIIKKYGLKEFNALLKDFETGVSGQITADRMGVSRERVRQWRTALGATVTLYQVHPEVEQTLRAIQKRRVQAEVEPS